MDSRERAAHRRFRTLAASLLGYENIPTTVTTEDAPGPDLDSPVAWIAVSAKSFAFLGHNLASARRDAREAGDARPVVLVTKHERAGEPLDAVCVLSVHDAARLLGRVLDAEGVAA